MALSRGVIGIVSSLTKAGTKRDTVAGRRPGPQSAPTKVRVELTALERRRYVHWWIYSSGLTKKELRQIATAMWSDRVLEELGDNYPPRAA